MTVGDLLCRASSQELAEWRAYFRLRDRDAKLAEQALAGLPRRARRRLP